jgi:molybdate transport system substrate-binding protein
MSTNAERPLLHSALVACCIDVADAARLGYAAPMRIVPRIVLAFACTFAAQATLAADLKVLSAGAFKPVLVALQPVFERATGHHLVIANDTAGALQKRILGGEAFDVVFSSPASLQALRDAGRLAADGPVPVARVGIGVAVKRGTVLPDISTVDAFRTVLLEARSVAYIDPAAGGSSGVYLEQLFERWGIAPLVHGKAVLVPGGLVATHVVDGSAELAIHQISEILAVPGAQLVGPLPPEIQNYTVYAGALSAQTQYPEAARQLLAALRGPQAEAILKAKGMEGP